MSLPPPNYPQLSVTETAGCRIELCRHAERADRSTALWRRRFMGMAAFFILIAATCPSAQAWGPQGHDLVTRWAFQTLPQPLRTFFESRSAQVLSHANDPAEWLIKDRYEKYRQYIYLDDYGRFPYLELPRDYQTAIHKYGSRHIAHDGTLPWQIGEFSLRLTNDMRAQNWNKALADAAALGYYIADAHDPLNTTDNHDGQLTGQTGLDRRFSDDLVSRYKNFILFRPVPASKIDDPTEYAFQIVLEANSWVDRILLADRRARDDLPAYNQDYFDRFYTSLSSMARQELSGAAHDIGSYWYTAWLNAGEPPLPIH
ncbi:MAG: hypothetical protein ACRD3O_07195 [Terriglobia bacterium]